MEDRNFGDIHFLDSDPELREIYSSFFKWELGQDLKVKSSFEAKEIENLKNSLLIIGPSFIQNIKTSFSKIEQSNTVIFLGKEKLNSENCYSFENDPLDLDRFSTFLKVISTTSSDELATSDKFKRIKSSIFKEFNTKQAFDIYVQTGDSEFQIINNKSNPNYFDEIEIYYETLEYFYLDSIDYIELIQKIVHRLYLKFDKAESLSFRERLSLIYDSFYVAYELLDILGFDQNLERLISHIYKEIAINIESFNFKEFIDFFIDKNDYLVDHTIVLAHFLPLTLRHLKESKFNQKDFIFAALLHDMTLRSSLLCKISDVYPEQIETLNFEQQSQITRHPELIVKICKNSELISSTIVDLLLNQHQKSANSDESIIFNTTEKVLAAIEKYGFQSKNISLLLYELQKEFNQGLANKVLLTLGDIMEVDWE